MPGEPGSGSSGAREDLFVPGFGKVEFPLFNFEQTLYVRTPPEYPANEKKKVQSH
jgi:hypothetical protein